MRCASVGRWVLGVRAKGRAQARLEKGDDGEAHGSVRGKRGQWEGGDGPSYEIGPAAKREREAGLGETWTEKRRKREKGKRKDFEKFVKIQTNTIQNEMHQT